jgi:hypothetical protein
MNHHPNPNLMGDECMIPMRVRSCRSGLSMNWFLDRGRAPRRFAHMAAVLVQGPSLQTHVCRGYP